MLNVGLLKKELEHNRVYYCLLSDRKLLVKTNEDSEGEEEIYGIVYRSSDCTYQRVPVLDGMLKEIK